MKKEVKNSIRVILTEGVKYLAFLIVFIILSKLLLDNAYSTIMKFDNLIIDFVKKYLENDVLTALMTAITYVGSYGSYIIIVLCSLIILRKKIILPIFMGLIVGGTGVINKIVKLFIERERPLTALIEMPHSFSFPSGHAMCAVVFYMYLINLTKTYVKNKTIKNTLIVFLVMMPILISFSRVYLGVHYATDVIFGALVGFVTYFPLIKVLNSLKEVFK